jgi:hypothetical protein
MSSRLQITGNGERPFGGIHIILCGDLKQLPPVNAKPVYKLHRNTIAGSALWHSLHYYPLVRVMRQSDEKFSNTLTNIGNGQPLDRDEIEMIVSRFRTKQWCDENVPCIVRLYHRNSEVDAYNRSAIPTESACDVIAIDNSRIQQ